MKKQTLFYVVILNIFLAGSVKAQSLVFNTGSYGFGCGGGGFGCFQQPNYDVSANTSSGNIFLLKKEYTSATGNYDNKLIKFDSIGNRLAELPLRSGTYKRIVADNSNGIFVLSVHNDSVYTTRFDQSTLTQTWTTGIYNAAAPEAFDICNALGYIYFGSNDANGMHLYQLKKGTGVIFSYIHYNTAFISDEHGLDIEASGSAIYVAGYLSEPGTIYGDEFWIAKFSSILSFTWENYYNKNLSFTNNADRASHVRISKDSIYVCGTSTRSSGDVDAVLIKYDAAGSVLWTKQVDKGTTDHTVDCAVDNSKGDVYLLQNAFSTTNKIFVTRFNGGGTYKWARSYTSTETSGVGTLGKYIFADPNPGGGGCEIYVCGQREDTSTDPHGYTNGLNNLAYKYNRSGTLSVFLADNAGFIGPLVGIKGAAFFSSYVGGPRLLLLSDGDYSNPSPGYYGWRLMSYNVNSIARIAEEEGVSTANAYPVQLYPNPASDRFILSADDDIQQINIYNMQGQLVSSVDGSGTEMEINTHDLQKGLYVVMSVINNTPIYSRLMVN